MFTKVLSTFFLFLLTHKSKLSKAEFTLNCITVSSQICGIVSPAIPEGTTTARIVMFNKTNYKNIQEVRINDSKNITRLKGLNQFTELRKLNVYSTNIQTFEGLKELKNLTSIIIRDNTMKTVTDFFSPSTEALEMNAGEIETVSDGVISNLSNLLRLNLAFNNITKLQAGIFSRTKLVQVELTKNKLVDIEGVFTGLSTIKAITLGANLIETITQWTFAFCYNLRQITLDRNRLVTIAFNAFEHHLQLHRIVFSENPTLKNLTLNFIVLKPLQEDERLEVGLQMSSLRYLDISNSFLLKNLTISMQDSDLSDLVIKMPNTPLIVLASRGNPLSQEVFHRLVSLPSLTSLAVAESPTLNGFYYNKVEESDVEHLELSCPNMSGTSLLDIFRHLKKLKLINLYDPLSHEVFCRRLIGDFSYQQVDDKTMPEIFWFNNRKIECFDFYSYYATVQ